MQSHECWPYTAYIWPFHSDIFDSLIKTELSSEIEEDLENSDIFHANHMVYKKIV